MSQSLSRSRPRLLLRAGLTAGVVGAALLVAPQAAYAATTVGPSLLAPGAAGANIFDPNANFNTTTAVVQLALGTATCRTTYLAPVSGSTWDATVTNRTSTRIDFTVPAGVTAGTNGVARAHNVCVYTSTGANGGSIALQGSAPAYVGQQPNSSAMSGPTGGGNQLTITAQQNSPVFTAYNNVAAVFNPGGGQCNTSLGSSNPSNLLVTGVTKLSATTVSLTVPSGVVVPPGEPGPTLYNICLYDGTTVNGVLLTIAPYEVSIASAFPASGNYLANTGITVNSTMPFLSGVTTPAVLLVRDGGCPFTYSTSLINGIAPVVPGAGAVRRLTNYRGAVTVPPLALRSAGEPTQYQVCFYPSTTGSLLGTATYTAAVVANPSAVLPSAGPAGGKSTITVVGTDFPMGPGLITATLGGAPLSDIQTLNDKAFTATTPSHTPEKNVALVVTTSAGSKTLPAAYDYLNPVKVTPNTAPNTARAVDVSVGGMNFMSIPFGTSANAGRVFLVDGVYDGSTPGGGARANGPVAECVNVLPISDEELICTLQLNRRLDTTGAYFNPVTYSNVLTTDVTTTAGSRVITSAGGKFGPNDVGQPIVQSGGTANIPASTIVTSVLSPTKAVMSMPSPATEVTPFTATVGNSTAVRTIASALSTTTGSTKVSLISGAFTSADIGRVFHNTPGIPNFTTIVAVAPGGASATLSEPATATTAGTLANVTVGASTLSTIESAAIALTDQYAVIGANSIGIPVGTTISAVGNVGVSGTLSAPAVGGGTTSSLPVDRVVTANLYAAAAVPEGSYHVTVVSNGAPDAVNTDLEYSQSDITSSSVFTVASF